MEPVLVARESAVSPPADHGPRPVSIFTASPSPSASFNPPDHRASDAIHSKAERSGHAHTLDNPGRRRSRHTGPGKMCSWPRLTLEQRRSENARGEIRAEPPSAPPSGATPGGKGGSSPRVAVRFDRVGQSSWDAVGFRVQRADDSEEAIQASRARARTEDRRVVHSRACARSSPAGTGAIHVRPSIRRPQRTQ